jgi:hypothetical protein
VAARSVNVRPIECFEAIEHSSAALAANELQTLHNVKIPWLKGTTLGSTAEQVARTHQESRIAV